MNQNLRTYFTGLFLLGYILQGNAQTVPVTIQVTDPKNDPVPFASIKAVDRLDSLIKFEQVADSAGRATFQLNRSGQYLIQVTAINFPPFEKGISVMGDKPRFSFMLEPVSATLKGVVVTSQRPMIRQEDDKTIIDPENLVASSTSGYEVIEKTPGLFVDQDGNIYISSMTPASVYINGREMKMSAADVATMLKSLPPNSIEKIEIMRTPSAKYDASGSGGIVNVVLKKGIKIGMTGSINLGGQQGTYGNQFIGFNLNNTVGKRSSYVNLNYSRRNSYEKILTDRIFAPDTMLGQNAYTKYPAEVYFAGFGLGYQINEKWDIAYDGRISLNDYKNITDNYSSISKISSSELLTSNLATVRNDGSSFTTNHGVSLKYKIDSAGSEWSNDISYTYSGNNADQDFNTVFMVPVIPTIGGDGNSNNKRNFVTAQSDLRLKLKKQFLVETGVKTSILGYNSVTDYYKQSGSTRTKDPSRTNTFKYNENINAVYLQGSKTIEDIVIKFGTRLENTNMKGRQLVPGDTSFNVHRTDLFPYVYLSKKLMTIAGFDLRAYLVYRRTISRPVYEQLNPFARYVDQYLSEMGNPGLKPQFTTNYEANISVDERPILAVGYNDTKDIFTNVIYQADSTRSQAYRTYDNLGSNKEWYFRALGAIPPGKGYFFVIGTQFNYNIYDGLYEAKPLSFKRGTWTFFTYQTLKVGKKSQITLNGFMRLKGQQQLYELGSFGALNLSINRKFLKDKLVATLSLSDVFATNNIDFTINQGSVNANGYRQNDTRRVGINLRYNFGLRKKDDNINMFNVESPVAN